MDKNQFATLAIGIKSAYPASKILEDTASKDFWYMLLSDIPYDVAKNAVMEHICTNVFAPNVAEIRKLCMERCKQPVPSFDEAWGVVQKAISKYGLNNAQEAFATMDELTLSVVKNLGWRNLCVSEAGEADRANFRMAYEAKEEAVKKGNQLPDFVAKNKALLKAQYIPAIEVQEESVASQIEQKEPVRDIKEELTPEQLEKQSKRFEEARRRILGGKT